MSNTIDNTDQGEQRVIPGAGRIAQREQLERRMVGPLRARKAQRPADDGLFDVAGRGQQDLLK